MTSIFIYRLISIKIPACLFAEIDKLILRFRWKCKGLKVVKKNWKMNKKNESHTSSFQNLVLNSNLDRVGYVHIWHMDSHTTNWNKTDGP